MSEIERILSASADITESVRGWITSPTAERIGERIKAASRGSFIPDSGFATVPMLAALFGLTERSIEDRITDTNPQKYGYGRAALYSLADFVKPKT